MYYVTPQKRNIWINNSYFFKTFTLKKNKTLIKHLIYCWKKWLSTVINKYDGIIQEINILLFIWKLYHVMSLNWNRKLNSFLKIAKMFFKPNTTIFKLYYL